MKKTEFRKAIGMSQSTLAKLSNNEKVSMDIIIKICRILNCTVDEIKLHRKGSHTVIDMVTVRLDINKD